VSITQSTAFKIYRLIPPDADKKTVIEIIAGLPRKKRISFGEYKQIKLVIQTVLRKNHNQ